jgi:hypothetical protein
MWNINTPKQIDKNSWHYKLVYFFAPNIFSKKLPKSECSYFWRVIFLLILSPLWFLGILYDNVIFNGKEIKRDSEPLTTSLGIAFTISIITFIVIHIFSVFLSAFYYKILPTANPFSFYGYSYLFYTTLLITIIGLGGTVKIGQVLKKHSKPKFTFFNVFTDYIKSKKVKVCREVEYIEE